jgi:uncharacterized protein (DUF4415 family)
MRMTKNAAASKSEWIDPDDAPELDDYWFDRADLMIGDTVIRRGRPAGETKTQVSLRIDNDVLAAFRAEGPGWQSRMNAALKKAAGV